MIKIILTIMTLAIATNAWALDAVQVPAKDLLITWEEPTTNADGSPLDDLAKIVIRGTVDGIDLGLIDAPVSGPTGGQIGSHTLSNVCAPNTKPVVMLDVRAVDFVGNESEPATITKTMDCLPPGKVK